MAKYLVPVTYEITADIEVEAENPACAIETAKTKYAVENTACFLGKEVEVDFAYGENVGEVIPLDE